MDDQYHNDNSRFSGPPKREWIVQRLPIKSGALLRSAMHVELFYREIPWSIIEGYVRT